MIAAAQETPRPPLPDLMGALGVERPVRPQPGPPAEGDDEQFLAGVFEVNEQCLEMLVSFAREEPQASFRLVRELADLLKGTDPAIRRRAARQSFLLLDMEFGNIEWWRGAGSHISAPVRLPYWRCSFPRKSGARLARAALLLAWNHLRSASDPATVRVLLGMTPEVGGLIASLRFDQIDRLAQKRFRFLRPRWDDRPAVWRRLLLAARSGDPRLMGEFNLQGLQLLSGDLMDGAPAREGS